MDFSNNVVSFETRLAKKQTYSEEELIALIQQRDQKAFTYLYENYSRALSGVIYTVLKDVEESEDTLQKTFLKIWNNFASYDATKGRLYTWMLNIARNTAIDSTRSKHEKAKSKIQSASDNVYQYENIAAEENTGHENLGVKTIVDKLKEEHRTLIDLAYYEGYTQEEISKKLALPLGTVKTRLRQALIKLREFTKGEVVN